MKTADQDAQLVDICGKLYDIVDDNLRKSGNVFRFSRELTISQTQEGTFDPFDFDGLSCHDFLMACYMRLLGRLPMPIGVIRHCQNSSNPSSSTNTTKPKTLRRPRPRFSLLLLRQLS